MTRASDNYSRFVAWAKVVLPLTALGLLSTLFLISDRVGTTENIPYADVELEEIAREQGISAPKFTSVTDDGASVAIVADKARPDPEDLQTVWADRIVATWINTEGSRLDITAQKGILHGAQNIIELTEGVEILSSNGYLINAETLTTSMKTTEIASDFPIRAIGPIGQFDAGAMKITQSDQRYVMVFSKGVKLIYDPLRGTGE